MVLYQTPESAPASRLGPAALNLLSRAREQPGPQARTFVEEVIGRSVRAVIENYM
ncbi:hypothetical protein [Arthrobacter sp. ok909]|uniref:hypothetical protein n=1 Tax=Arthrobacter sp. ok909 TaxID=1761746 RepID=UPI0015875970|nr:hypothetical protein [Arthrobacter sp. ok909]